MSLTKPEILIDFAKGEGTSNFFEIKVQKPENPKPKEIEEDDGDLDEL